MLALALIHKHLMLRKCIAYEVFCLMVRSCWQLFFMKWCTCLHEVLYVSAGAGSYGRPPFLLISPRNFISCLGGECTGDRPPHSIDSVFLFWAANAQECTGDRRPGKWACCIVQTAWFWISGGRRDFCGLRIQPCDCVRFKVSGLKFLRSCTSQ